MSNITKNEIKNLVNLQQIELEIHNLEANLSNVDQRIADLDKELLDFKNVIEEQQAVIEELNQKYRRYESDVRLNLDSIKKSEAKLSSVKTNKEYQSSLKEIDDIKDKNSAIEDDMIEILDRIEEAENLLKAKMKEYDELQAQLNREKDIIVKKTQQDKQHIENLDTELKTLTTNIDAALLRTYQQVKSNQSNAVGIVAVIDAVCQGCHMNIPPQMYNELQRGDHLTKCPICQRLIYWKNIDKRSE